MRAPSPVRLRPRAAVAGDAVGTAPVRPRIGPSGSRLPAFRPAALSSVGAQHQGAFLLRLAGSGADEPLADRTPYPRALLLHWLFYSGLLRPLELSVLRAAEKRIPFARSEDQNGSALVFGVTHSD